ncbi:hypothetical protein KSS87_020125 [Heliosperma pusillum]|nr:hypothetical protein KSS87_020125 [Heliosperma pusillum]
MAETATPKKIMLKSSDGEDFEVDEIVAMESQTIKNMIEDDCADNAIPLPNVTAKILSKVIEYCKKHVEAAAAKTADATTDTAAGVAGFAGVAGDDDELMKWDAEFVKADRNALFDLILAANYLNIKSLLDLTCQSVADMIKDMTPEEVRKVIEYCKKHVEAAAAKTADTTTSTAAGVAVGDAELKKWDEEFVNVNQTTLFDLILAANYLNIKSLLELTCQTVADNIKNKTVEEVRTILNITNDFTPEEEEEVRKENQWAFE